VLRRWATPPRHGRRRARRRGEAAGASRGRPPLDLGAGQGVEALGHLGVDQAQFDRDLGRVDLLAPLGLLVDHLQAAHGLRLLGDLLLHEQAQEGDVVVAGHEAPGVGLTLRQSIPSGLELAAEGA
jgi:hypothetical protein